MRLAAAVAFLATVTLAHPARAEAVAFRAGWAYGLGAEIEYRPRMFGIGVSGGYVPDHGAGGYAGVQWGAAPISRSGFVAEAGAFRGVHNPFRVARTGYGAYALAGFAFVHERELSVRAVAGAGWPLDDPDHRDTAEFLAKLTAGIVF